MNIRSFPFASCFDLKPPLEVKGPFLQVGAVLLEWVEVSEANHYVTSTHPKLKKKAGTKGVLQHSNESPTVSTKDPRFHMEQ